MIKEIERFAGSQETTFNVDLYHNYEDVKRNYVYILIERGIN